MNSIYGAVKNIIVFMLLLTIILNLFGKSKFKQYINIFAGMVLIIIVCQPILKLFRVSDRLDYYFGMNQYKMEISDISGKLVDMEEKQKEQIFEKYKDSITGQVKLILSNHNLGLKSIVIELEEDSSNELYGEVKKINVVAQEETVSEQGEKSAIDKVIINKITIDEGIVEKDDETENSEAEGGKKTILEMSIAKEIALLYNLELNIVNVTIT